MKKNVILVLVLLFAPSFSLTNVGAEQKEITYIVIYDEAHLQFFTHELMNTALTSLNSTFDTDSIDVTIDLVINEESFTASNVQGADLIIIPSPNLDEDKRTNAVIGENTALSIHIKNGGSVFYLANPYSTNTSIASHVEALSIDRLLAPEVGSEVMLGNVEVIDNDNATILIDDDNNDGNNSHIYLDQDNIQFDSWNNELNTISKVLYYGAALTSVRSTSAYGNASKYTYAIDQEYTIKNPDGDGHKWVSGNSFGENDGRSILIGSTIMFSDYQYNDSSSWVDVEDNLALFQNLVAWLLKITPLNIPQETIDNDFSYFLTTNILLGILIPLAFISLVFGILLRSKSLTFSRIFDFKVKRKKVTKKATKETKKTTKKTTKKATKKTRRKRS
ncbi:MAG: hypothetical protein HeimC2_03120 [Candidatus Heimdallarchaeota archaeon LC_2]|nr:MAG: hypothetical protein HeimC2_03120 [Candidatus Heimdallarchaeota archaeon LC_2]